MSSHGTSDLATRDRGRLPSHFDGARCSLTTLSAIASPTSGPRAGRLTSSIWTTTARTRSHSSARADRPLHELDISACQSPTGNVDAPHANGRRREEAVRDGGAEGAVIRATSTVSWAEGSSGRTTRGAARFPRSANDRLRRRRIRREPGLAPRRSMRPGSPAAAPPTARASARTRTARLVQDFLWAAQRFAKWAEPAYHERAQRQVRALAFKDLGTMTDNKEEWIR